MKVAIMQPTFLPWIGYFAMIKSSDIFVFLDTVQFE
ncbi:WbqC family protein, partial [Campylobacter avium]